MEESQRSAMERTRYLGEEFPEDFRLKMVVHLSGTFILHLPL